MWLQKLDRRPLVQPNQSHSWCCHLLLLMGGALLASSARCGQNWSPILQITWKELCIFISYFPFLSHPFTSLLVFPASPLLNLQITSYADPENWVIPSFLKLLSVLPPQIPGLKCSEKVFSKGSDKSISTVFWVSPKAHLAQYQVPVSGQKQIRMKEYKHRTCRLPKLPMTGGSRISNSK